MSDQLLLHHTKLYGEDEMSSAICTKYVHLQLKHIEDYIKMYYVCNNAVNTHCTHSIRLLAAVNKAIPIVTMAVASGLAGRVLA